MATTSYGSITIVDLTDVGQFSVYPYANSGNTQIYSEETQGYTPDWSASPNLVITPVITYAGNDVTQAASVRWYVKGSDTPISTINAGVANKALTISQNLTDVVTRTYVVRATYTTQTSATVNAEGEITFNKLIQTSSAKGVRISGNNVFKYQSGSTSPTETSIVLTPTPTGEVGFPTNAWKYWNGSSWVTTSGIITENSSTHTLVVPYSFAGFNNDVARFQVTVNATYGSHEAYTDEFSITNLRDGAAGDQLISIDLSNDTQLVPFDSDGNDQIDTIGNLAGTTIRVLEGNDDITASSTVYVQLTNVTAVQVKDFGTASAQEASLGTEDSNHRYTLNVAGGYTSVKVTDFSSGVSAGSVKFIVVDNNIEYSKIFSLVGVEAGEDGDTPVVYSLNFSEPVKRNNSATAGASADVWSYSPKTLTVTAKSTASTATYAGDIWYKRKGDSSWTRVARATGTASITVASTLTIDKSPIVFRLTTANAANSNNYLDEETIVVTSDGSVGAKGEEGDDGVSALNVILYNENDTIRATSDWKTIGQTIQTQYQGYEGTTAKSFTFIGMTADSSAPSGLFGTVTQSNGVISIPVNSNVNVSSYQKGYVRLGFSYTDSSNATTTIYKDLTFNVQAAAEDGTPAIYLQTLVNNSTFFRNQTGSVTITPYLIRDGQNIFNTTNYTIAWKEILSNTTLTAQSDGSCIVNASDISGAGSVLCTVTDKADANKVYKSYTSFNDYSDPLLVEVLCTLGEKIVNSIGEGVIYALTTQNGTTLDPVAPNTNVVTSSTGLTDTQIFMLTKSNNKVTGITLKTNTGSAGAYTNAAISPLKYEWSFRDIEGDPLELADLKTLGLYISTGSQGADYGQFVYINPAVVNKKISVICKVTK